MPIARGMRVLLTITEIYLVPCVIRSEATASSTVAYLMDYPGCKIKF